MDNRLIIQDPEFPINAPGQLLHLYKYQYIYVKTHHIKNYFFGEYKVDFCGIKYIAANIYVDNGYTGTCTRIPRKMLSDMLIKHIESSNRYGQYLYKDERFRIKCREEGFDPDHVHFNVDKLQVINEQNKLIFEISEFDEISIRGCLKENHSAMDFNIDFHTLCLLINNPED